MAGREAPHRFYGSRPGSNPGAAGNTNTALLFQVGLLNGLVIEVVNVDNARIAYGEWVRLAPGHGSVTPYLPSPAEAANPPHLRVCVKKCTAGGDDDGIPLGVSLSEMLPNPDWDDVDIFLGGQGLVASIGCIHSMRMHHVWTAGSPWIGPGDGNDGGGEGLSPDNRVVGMAVSPFRIPDSSGNNYQGVLVLPKHF